MKNNKEILEVVSAYLNQKCIFIERGLVKRVQLKKVALDENDFLSALIVNLDPKTPGSRMHFEELEIGSVSVDVHKGILSARGYVSWSLVFADPAFSRFKEFLESSVANELTEIEKYSELRRIQNSL